MPVVFQKLAASKKISETEAVISLISFLYFILLCAKMFYFSWRQQD